MCCIVGYQGTKLKIKQIDYILSKDIERGPDAKCISKINNVFLGFNRLAIMDLSDSGDQPFKLGNTFVVCNGEIYDFKKYKEELIKDGVEFHSQSDCEVILPMYAKYGKEVFSKLGSEFALIIYDGATKELIAARDPIGIRPLYYTYTKDKEILFSSEPKCLSDFGTKIEEFPTGHYWVNGTFYSYLDVTDVKPRKGETLEEIEKNINQLLSHAIEQRLDSDANVGYLLSGGLDSSLVCAVAAKKLGKGIRTFSIGMEDDPIDLKYARIVSEYLGTNHTEVIITKKNVIEVLPEVIKMLGSYDITTIRASIGMYLLCKYIKRNTDIKVVLTGEISDELFGYKYTDFAPNGEAFQVESIKRIKELHSYDVLRADRCISSNSLEARVPFSDTEFVKYVLGIDPQKKLNTHKKGKYLLRMAFKGDYLPEEILMREKAAFSDGVGHSLVDVLKEYAESAYTQEEYLTKIGIYAYQNPPISKESLLYRDIFESFYPGQAHLIPAFWLPNQEWVGIMNDPSARYLKNYGDSGK